MRADRLLGSRLIAGPAAVVTARQLRVLAYHGVPDPDALDAQLRELLRRRFVPVPVEQVLASLDEGADALPERAVCVTFDDGYRDVVDHGLAVLERHRVRACLFVCPGVIEAGTGHWFDAASRAAASGWAVDGARGPIEVLARLKAMPDADRRAAVASLPPGDRPVVEVPDLRRWVDAGMAVGNHTWDHPLLDRVDGGEVEPQIERAREWLDRELPGSPPVFAYPNGDWSPDAEAALERSSERVALLFDHRLTPPTAPRYRLSRLRIGSDVSVARFRAIVSGAHPVLFHRGRRDPRVAAP